MIVTCEKCQKRYLVKDEDIGSEGRQVRCVSCGHRWFQKPPESVKNLTQEIETPEFFHDRVEDKKTGKLNSSFLIFLTLLFFTAALGYLTRQEIVKLWPESAWFYRNIGLSVPYYETGLKLMNVHPLPVEENDQHALIIKGDVVNSTKDVQILPPLRIELLGPCNNSSSEELKNQCILKKWKHYFAESRLLPGEKISFETEPTDSSEKATDIRVYF